MRSARILVVDDDANMQLLVAYHLQKRGYSVLIAEDGAVALDLARREPFDLFLLDVMLPEISGFDLCRALRAETVYRDTPILLVTARGQESDEDTAEACGATACIRKPFDPIRLTDTVGDQLAARSGAIE